jgi:hypothetical protein
MPRIATATSEDRTKDIGAGSQYVFSESAYSTEENLTKSDELRLAQLRRQKGGPLFLPDTVASAASLGAGDGMRPACGSVQSQFLRAFKSQNDAHGAL